MISPPSSNLTAALELAALDWPVFPCVEARGEKAKSPYTKNGFHDASTDPILITRWWEYRPNALIGIAIPAYMMVIDIDPRNGGSLSALEGKAGTMPDTLTSISGRMDNGQHLWFYRPKGELTNAKRSTGSRPLPAGIDLKDGSRAYVIAPPSLHPDTGQPYVWKGFEPAGPVACCPFRLAELLKPEPAQMKRLFNAGTETGDFTGLLTKVAATQEGSRNDYTFWAACRLAEKGALDSHEEMLTEAALSSGLSEREIQTCITSARRRIG